MRWLQTFAASMLVLMVAASALAAGRLETGTWPGAQLAKSGRVAAPAQAQKTSSGILLAAASPTFTGAGTVTVGSQSFTIGVDAFASVQAAIDAVDAGGTVWVLPGHYLEAAAGRTLYNGAGPYQFGIFVGAAKPNLTLTGVDAAGNAITSFGGVLSMIDTQARNSFGTAGFFIEGDHCTITGIGVGVNDVDPQKTVEVIGDAFTIKYCQLADIWGGVIYVDDYRFDAPSNTSYVKSYDIENNNFQEGMDFQAASGAGYSGPVSGRVIAGNTFTMNPGQNWAAITFNGAGGVGWFTYPVGGAVITGNTFVNTDPTGQHIKARGDYLEAQMDWAAYWNGNTFNKAACEGLAPPASLRAYDYSVYTNARRIGAVIQDEIVQAVAGDVLLVKPGAYDERLLIDKPMTLRGATSGVSKRGFTVPPAYAYDATTQSIVRPGTPAEKQVVDIAADGVVFDGFVVANEVCQTGGVYQDLVGIDQYLAAPTGIQVLNCVLGPNTNTASQDGTKGRCGVTVYGPHSVPLKLFVLHNRIFDAKGNGGGIMVVGPYGPTYHGGAVYTNNFAGSVIEDNDILGNHRSGIELAGGVQGGTAPADAFVVRNNLIAGNGWFSPADKDNLKFGHGIAFIRAGSDRANGDAAGPRYVRLENNVIRDNEKSGLYVGPKTRDLSGTGNVLQDNGKGTGGYSLWDGVRVDMDELYYPAGTAYTDYGYLTNVSFTAGSIAGNGALGVRVTQAPTAGAVVVTRNWWGDALGPNVAPVNPSPANGLAGLAAYAPWCMAPGGPCESYGANSVAAGTSGLCLATVHPTASVPVVFTRDASPALGVSVKLQLSANLQLVDPAHPVACFHLGSWLAGFESTFQVVDLGGGLYRVDQAILGQPCGVSGSGTLFSVDVQKVAGSTDGTGTITVTYVAARDCSNVPLGGIPGAPASLAIDFAAPAAMGDLAAVQQKEGNVHTAQTTNVTLTFTAPGDAAVQVYRAPFGGTAPAPLGTYPEYTGGIPAAPSYPPSAPWALTPVTSSGGQDNPGARGFWYYVAFATDACGNTSPVSNVTAGKLDYFLGDVAGGSAACVGNNMDNGLDISAMGFAYGATPGPGDPNACLDVGPTTSGLVDARPVPDDQVDFEDMIMFAMNYLRVTAPMTVATLAPADRNELSLDAPDQVAAGATFTVALRFRGTGTLQGLSTQLGWDRGVAEPLSLDTGDLLRSQDGVAFSARAGNVDAAVLGAGRGITGEGTLATLTFRARQAGDPQVRIASTDARDTQNQRVALAGSRPLPPTRSGLMPAMPNPFTRTTALAFSLARAGRADLVVYSVDGRRVRVLAGGAREAGEYRLTWDGTDDGGQSVKAGVYFVRLSTADGHFNRTLVLTR